MSSLVYRFTIRRDAMPTAHQHVPDGSTISRFVEYDLVENRGTAYYATGPENHRVRCVHDPLVMTNTHDLATRMLGWMGDWSGSERACLAPDWPEDLQTCESESESLGCEHLRSMSAWLNREGDNG